MINVLKDYILQAESVAVFAMLACLESASSYSSYNITEKLDSNDLQSHLFHGLVKSQKRCVKNTLHAKKSHAFNCCRRKTCRLAIWPCSIRPFSSVPQLLPTVVGLS